MSKKYVSGPMNLVRLHDDNKVLFIFMDYHRDPHFQTECTDIESKHFRDYLLDNFKKVEKKCDFFLEEMPDMFNKYDVSYTDRYLHQIRDLFKKLFDYDPVTNTVNQSKLIPNVRFHYIDIRPYFSFKKGSPALTTELEIYALNLSYNTMYPNELKTLGNILMSMGSKLILLYNSILKNEKKVSKQTLIKYNTQDADPYYTSEEAEELIKYILNKILNKYNNKDIKEKILYIIHNELMPYIQESFALFEEYYKIINSYIEIFTDKYPNDKINYKGNEDYAYMLRTKINKDTLCDILSINEKLCRNVDDVYLMIMDLYMLRRFLDKSYVTNACVYAGQFHGTNYVRLLVKYFNFKISHCFYAELPLDKITNRIKESKFSDLNHISGLFLPNKLIQCIEVSQFPDLFS